MKRDDFKTVAHGLTLLAAFPYFDIGFMAWTSLVRVQLRWRSPWGALSGTRV